MGKYDSTYNSADNYKFDTSDIQAKQKQQEEKRKLRRVYSTELINELISERNLGYDIPYDAFFQRDLELRAPAVTFRMTPEEMEIYQKCYDDAIFYVKNYCKFMTDKGRTTVDLRQFQEKIIKIVTDETYIPEIDDFGPQNRNVVWMAARQSGKTTTVAAFLSWMLVFHSDRNILVVANKEKTAIEIVDKIINVFRGLPYFMKPGCVNFGKMGLKLENGSQLMCSATTNTASIGFTIHCILLDEFAHIPENIVNNFWRSVYPTLSSSKISQCIITSTPNGTTNKFYEIWSNSIEKKNSFVNLRTDYYEVPGHDDEWAAKMKADFGEEEFAQEFQLQFNINSRMLAKAEDLRFMQRLAKEFIHKDIYGGNVYLNDEHLVWHPDFDPNEINETDKFVFLVDLAEGAGEEDKMFKSKKKDPDFNTVNIFKLEVNSIANMRKYSDKSCKVQDAFKFIQVGKYSSNVEDEEYCAKICSALAYDLMKDDERDSVRIMVEMNFNGKSFTNTIRLHPKYTDSTIQRTYHTKPVPGEKQRRHLGFKTTANKEYYCIKGNKMINMKRIIVTDKKTYEQIQSFGYIKGKLKGIACHDDLSMPVFNHIPRMIDDETFIAWLEEILYEYEDETKKYKINQMIEKWDMDNPETSDSDFNSMYNIPETYNMLQTSPYNENLQQQLFNRQI
jgi:hypothetical protein